jgi:hypothetical protein
MTEFVDSDNQVTKGMEQSHLIYIFYLVVFEMVWYIHEMTQKKICTICNKKKAFSQKVVDAHVK